jgi:hypothetical protein
MLAQQHTDLIFIAKPAVVAYKALQLIETNLPVRISNVFSLTFLCKKRSS